MAKTKKPYVVNVEFRRLLTALHESAHTPSEMEASLLESASKWRELPLCIEERQAVVRAVYELERFVALVNGRA